MARFLKDKQKSKGAAPGSLIFIGRQKMDYSCIRVTQYNAEYVKEGEVKALDKISEYLSDDHVAWISVRGLQDTNLIGKLGKEIRHQCPDPGRHPEYGRTSQIHRRRQAFVRYPEIPEFQPRTP